MLFVDLEADSLNPTKIHCVAIGTIDGTVDLYSGADLLVAYDRLRSASVLVAQNGICYDFPVLERLAGIPRTYKEVDTLVCSSLLWPDIEGGHSLEAWGVRLGYPKMDYLAEYKAWKFATEADWVYEEGEEWREYNPVMGKYCKRDVEVLIKMWQHIKKELDQHDWKMALRLEHKIAEIMHQQTVDGWQFDVEKAKSLLAFIDSEVSKIDAELEKVINRKAKKKGVEVSAPFKKDGGYKASVIEWYGEEDSVHVAGPFTRVEWEFPNLHSRDQLAGILMSYGWKPTEFTETGKPKVTEESLESVVGDAGKKIAKRIKLLKRRSEIVGWLENVRPDGRIEARAFPQATPTGRMRHRNVVNLPKSTLDADGNVVWGDGQQVFLGSECRSLFIPKPGYVLVDTDAAGLELRMLAHYMGDPDFSSEVVDGDVHTRMWDITKEFVPSRSTQKNVTYGLIYGAGDFKLGQTAGADEKKAKAVGAEIRRRLMAGIPALGELTQKVARVAVRGYLVGLDGRKIPLRSEHAALNSLLQCAGSLSVKVALCYSNDQIKKRNLDARQIGCFHDQQTCESHPDCATEVGMTFVNGLKYAQHLFKLRCRLDGTPHIGPTFAHVH